MQLITDDVLVTFVETPTTRSTLGLAQPSNATNGAPMQCEAVTRPSALPGRRRLAASHQAAAAAAAVSVPGGQVQPQWEGVWGDIEQGKGWRKRRLTRKQVRAAGGLNAAA